MLGRFETAIMHAWMRRGLFACLAWPLAQIFGVVLKLRVLLYRFGWLNQYKLPVPVIVVGNIFIGGTGKTPFTLWLLGQLKRAGYTPGIVSRGYGSKQDAPRMVSLDSRVSQVGDEPLLLAQNALCPVVVGRDRVAAGKLLLATFPEVDVIVSDDGLQHLALARDVEIVMFDSRGAGNGWLLPAGPLREPITRCRDLTVVNLTEGERIRADFPINSVKMQLKGSHAFRLNNPNEIRKLSTIDSSVDAIAAAGIGNPERFFTLLKQQGVQCATLTLPDHYTYEKNPFAQIDAKLILVTEKDAVKCRQLKEIASDPRIWVVAVDAEIDADAFECILQKIH